jgi:hypothetical protein
MDIPPIHNKIYEICKQNVMLDFDLASLYEVETRVLNQGIYPRPGVRMMDFTCRLW